MSVTVCFGRMSFECHSIARWSVTMRKTSSGFMYCMVEYLSHIHIVSCLNNNIVFKFRHIVKCMVTVLSSHSLPLSLCLASTSLVLIQRPLCRREYKSFRFYFIFFSFSSSFKFFGILGCRIDSSLLVHKRKRAHTHTLTYNDKIKSAPQQYSFLSHFHKMTIKYFPSHVCVRHSTILYHSPYRSIRTYDFVVHIKW